MTINMPVKKLGFGCMRLPLTDPENQKSIDLEKFCEMVDAFLERGFTYFDTAYMYHKYQSENFVRQALVERHPRGSYTLASKLPLMNLKEEGDMERIFDEQLKKCGVDYFDYYLLHNIKKDNYETAKKFDCFSFVAKMKEAGKIKHIGFSFHDTPELLEEVLSLHPEMEFVQLQLNYIDWNNSSIQAGKCYSLAEKYNKPVVVMEPVKGGSLVNLPQEAKELFKATRPDMSVASWAIRFAASHKNVMVVLSGMSNIEQLLDNTSYMSDFKPLNLEETDIIDKVVDIINKTSTIGCTACGYCVEGCPQSIPIPEYFSIYNAQKFAIDQGSDAQKVYYENLAATHGKASDCIACGQCEKACPQHLSVIEYLKTVASVFE